MTRITMRQITEAVANHSRPPRTIGARVRDAMIEVRQLENKRPATSRHDIRPNTYVQNSYGADSG
jgi:hypothetical protein